MTNDEMQQKISDPYKLTDEEMAMCRAELEANMSRLRAAADAIGKEAEELRAWWADNESKPNK